MTTTNLLLDWSEFESEYLNSGIPSQYVVRSNPQVSIFVEQDTRRLGIRFETSEAASTVGRAGLAEVDIESVTVDAIRFLQFSTSNYLLYRNFYELTSEIASEVVARGANPIGALREAVRRWNELLSGPSVLSEERQRGLFGELWFLELAILRCGTSAISAWLGPEAQAHDFRFDGIEVEVKATSLQRRMHRISSLSQLEPSPESELLILSLMLADAGLGGESLPERVLSVAEHLSGDPEAIEEYERKLRRAGYSETHVAHYTSRHHFREEPRLIPVGDGVPRITREALSTLPVEYAAHGIQTLTYEVELSGFGELCDEDAFDNRVLGQGREF